MLLHKLRMLPPETTTVHAHLFKPDSSQSSDIYSTDSTMASAFKHSLSSFLQVLPTDHSPRFVKTKSHKTTDHHSNHQQQDPELKENNSQMVQDIPVPRKPARPASLLSEVRPTDNLPQSPENDHRSSEDYDPPWDLKHVLRPSGVNGSVSVPERLSSGGQGQQPHMTTSVTHDKLLEVDETKDRPATTSKPGGESSFYGILSFIPAIILG